MEMTNELSIFFKLRLAVVNILVMEAVVPANNGASFTADDLCHLYGP